jgi:flavorubredoxin
MNTDERRHLEMMAATIAAGLATNGNRGEIYMVRTALGMARQIQEKVQEMQAAKESNGA